MSSKLPMLSLVPDIAKLSAKKRAAGVEVVGPWGSGKALIAAQTAEALGVPLLYITHGRVEAESAHEDLTTFWGPERCALLPAWEVLPTDAMKPADDIVAERMNSLNAMVRARENGDALAVSLSVRSLLQRVVSEKHLIRDRIDLSVGEEHDLEEMVHRLTTMGYERELMVEQRGQMSVRGGIFDIFPISGELPYRVEFFGDEIESIRLFEPETQRSVERVQEVHILPRSEKDLLTDEAAHDGALSSVIDYLGRDIVVAIDEPMAVSAEAARLEEQFANTPLMATLEEILGRVKRGTRLSLAQVAHAQEEGTTRIRVPMLSMTGWSGKTEGFWDQLEQWGLANYAVHLYCNNTGEERRLLELLGEHGYRPGEETDFDLTVSIGGLHEGFSSEADKLAVLSEREMFGRKYVRRVRRRFEAGSSITAFSDVKAGDYIVHLEHGIGRYLGLRQFEGKKNEFMAIQYGAGDVVYVPVTHVDHVQKYVGGGGAVPKMDKIGGASWRKTKAKVKKAVQDMTEELLKLYATRQKHAGHSFSPDTHWQDEFEDAFEYMETADQLTAIADIKRDMESPKPMERLLCGDVGYGKTEVAIRAAFKTVMDKKQAAVLVPTTVLAEQHYLTFKERLADYPVRVEMLSRFRTPKEQKVIVRALREGEIDIVIGTHRLTSGDIQFKDLGLVVLDEEQRFGVKQKEKLKKLKVDVDVLTLTATPIPRTMHMSMSGVRDMSIINTAPNDRVPIHTCIEAFDEGLVTEAIRRELGREGQTFYLHNRVQSIEKVAGMIKKLVPEARVVIGHGQMGERDLEEVMAAFVRGEFDVLVCTTIIGSGLDIPNANTIIVDRADQFGLAELYQLRGRVGRYKHRAFAYLLVPGDKALSQDAQKRLKALEEFSTLGSGFRIAMRDLEIRGAGNLLGASQSGHIASVGYETYNQLIADAVAEMKGEPAKIYVLPQFDVPTDASIPDSYIELESQKITLYKRITSLKTPAEVDEMYEELRDRFGDPPRPVRTLLEVMRVRTLGAEVGARKIYVRNRRLTIDFDKSRFLRDNYEARFKDALGDRVQFGMNEVVSVALTMINGEDYVLKTAEMMKCFD